MFHSFCSQVRILTGPPVLFNWLLRTCFLKSHHNNWLHTDGYLQILWRQFDFWTPGIHLTSFKECTSEWVEERESALVTVVIKLERISYFIRSFTAISNAIINGTGTGFSDASASLVEEDFSSLKVSNAVFLLVDPLKLEN